MSRTVKIKHEGVVVDCDNEYISIEITGETNCRECCVKSMCTLSDDKAKIVQVENKGFNLMESGAKVNLIGKKILGLRSVWVCYLIPLTILLISILSLYILDLEELLIGLGALAALVVYYLIIFLSGDRMKKEWSFTVEK